MRRAGAVAVCLALLLRSTTFAAEPDWAAVERESAELLTALIRLDTTNPPGNETSAARLLADRFAAEGIDAEVLESAPGRGSVIARLRGTGAARPIILLNHLDVVPANASEWEVPPFEGVERGGFVYGRGALDCKGISAVDAMTLLLLKRQGIKLPRDVIFLGTADEETGGKLGAGWFVEQHFDMVADAEFVLNEGSHIHAAPNGTKSFQVAVAEKTPCWLKLTASGKPGHGSTPAAETSVTRLVRALSKLSDAPSPVRVTKEVQAYYAALAPLQVGPDRERFRDLRQALNNDTFRQQFLLDAHHAAMLRDTLTPTVLSASQKTNVIPSTAVAEVDCRLLPDADPRAFVDGVVKRIADPSVRVEVILNFPPSSSPTDNRLYRAIARQAVQEGGTIVPSVLSGFTDSHYFREKGIVSYGFAPFVLSDADTQGEHGLNEKLSTADLREGTRRLLELLQMIDAEKSDGESHAAR